MEQGRMVTFSSAVGPADAYLVRPERGRAAVIVLQEWWGLVPHIRDVAERFARAGYIALAPDLYHGRSTVDAEEASHLMHDLDWRRALDEIAGANRYLRDVCGAERVGVAGFCMGGALTIAAATLPNIDAYVSFYGYPPEGAADVSRVSAPGLVFFGEHEDVFSVPGARTFAERQRAAGREVEIVTYPDAGHAFFNDQRPEVYRGDAADDAWRRTLGHFERHLRP